LYMHYKQKGKMEMGDGTCCNREENKGKKKNDKKIGPMLPDTVFSSKVIARVAFASDRTASRSALDQLCLDRRVGGVSKVPDRRCITEGSVASSRRCRLLTFGRNPLHSRRVRVQHVEVHLGGIDRIPTHRLEHPAAIGVLLQSTTHSALVLAVQHVREE